MGYYEMKSAKVNMAHELMNRGWNVLGYKADESDSMTDYFSPASWDGLATKNGFVLVVDRNHNGDSGEAIKEYNYTKTSTTDYSKITKLEKMTVANGCTEEEAESAKNMIEKINNKESEGESFKILGYKPVYQANPNRSKWHIEKDGKIFDKGTGITKYQDLPDSYMFDMDTMEYKEGYKTVYIWNSETQEREKQKRELNEYELKAIKAFKKLMTRIDTIVNSEFSMGDGTEETEREGLNNIKNQGMKKVNKTITKKVWKMVEVADKKEIQKGDYLTFNYHGGCWLVTDVYDKKGKWNGIEETRQALNYEIVGAKSRGYKQLKNPKTYYQWMNSIQKGIEEGNIKIYELKEVEETTGVEKWVKIDNTKKTVKKESTPVKSKKEEVKINQKDNSNASESNIKGNNNSHDVLNLVTIKEDIHTKTREKLFIVKLVDKVEYEVFKTVEKEIKTIDGYYSRFKRGFIFKEDPINILKDTQIFNILTGEKEINNIEYPEIDINDIGTYTIDRTLSDRENNSWMFRTKNIDHQKEIQEYFQSYNNQILEVLKDTDNKYLIHNLKNKLQQFKKNYYKNNVAILNNRANNPSWLVTGRAGRNRNKDKKMNNRYETLVNKSVELVDKFKNEIEKTKNKIRVEKENKHKEEFKEVI